MAIHKYCLSFVTFTITPITPPASKGAYHLRSRGPRIQQRRELNWDEKGLHIDFGSGSDS